jgi:hypothetical protein
MQIKSALDWSLADALSVYRMLTYWSQSEFSGSIDLAQVSSGFSWTSTYILSSSAKYFELWVPAELRFHGMRIADISYCSVLIQANSVVIQIVNYVSHMFAIKLLCLY